MFEVGREGERERKVSGFPDRLSFVCPITDESTSFDNIFWIDVASQQAAEQGFMNISHHLKLEAQSFEQVLQYSI